MSTLPTVFGTNLTVEVIISCVDLEPKLRCCVVRFVINAVFELTIFVR